MRFLNLGSAFVLCGAVLFGSAERASAVVYDASADFLAMEQASTTGVNPNGVWTYGGYNALPGTFTAYTSAQHLENWGSMLPADGNGPFSNNEFQGYGFDTALAIPAIVVNTSNSNLSPCCGISAYAPGEVFLHSAVDGDAGAPQYNLGTFRFTAPEAGTADVSAVFTRKHGGLTSGVVLLNGTEVFNQTQGGQDQSVTYTATDLSLNAGDTLDFVTGGRASAAFDATIDFTPIPEPAAAALAALGGLLAMARRRRD
jgi:hypothetical protein